MKTLALELLVIVGLTLVNAFFSGAEIAILSVRKTRLRELADEGNRAARVALRLRGNPERFLATVQVGITVVGASAGAFGGAVLEAPIAQLLEKVGFGTAAENVSFALVVAFITVLSVVLGELVPKSLALRYSERLTLWVCRPLYALSRVAGPLIWFLTGASNLILRVFGDRTTFTEARLSSEELQQLMDEAAAAGTVDKEAGEIASRAIDLGTLKGFSVMVPHNEITWMALDASRERIEHTLRDKPHARYPVLDESQQAVGYVLAHELYAQLLGGAFDLRSLLREIPLFPETAAAVDILRALQRARSEIGLLVDESGFPTGLVSIETLAEELFGEIVAERESLTPSIAPCSETFEPSDERGESGERRGGARGRAFDVQGDTPIHELNRELDLELPIEPSASTLSGLVVAEYGGFPPRGARVPLPGGAEAEVRETSATRVLLVRLRLAPASS